MSETTAVRPVRSTRGTRTEQFEPQGDVPGAFSVEKKRISFFKKDREKEPELDAPMPLVTARDLRQRKKQTEEKLAYVGEPYAYKNRKPAQLHKRGTRLPKASMKSIIASALLAALIFPLAFSLLRGDKKPDVYEIKKQEEMTPEELLKENTSVNTGILQGED